jgi:hypothetical protein
MHDPTTPSPPRDVSRLRYASAHAWYQMAAVIVLTFALPLAIAFGKPVLYVSAVVCVVLLLWNKGITFDPPRRTVTTWGGPFFPLVWTRHRLGDYDTVAIVTDTYEVYTRHSHLSEQRQFGKATGLKLVARMTPGMRYPEELPPPLEIPLPIFRGLFGRKTTLEEEGKELAETLGFRFMDVQ